MTAVASLAGADLALWVARAAGIEACLSYQGKCWWSNNGHTCLWAPHEEWAQGGTLIDAHAIAVAKGANQICFPGWHAKAGQVNVYNRDQNLQFGPTPLIAAMRALVWSVYGDNVGEVKS